MRILADENMPSLDIFADLGEVRCCAGRQLTASALQETDVLLVRSVTRVNERLLAGTPVRFVGSATIGTDHVDLDWLRQAGIAFAHAPGCNAMAVVEYVLQAILGWCAKTQRTPAGLSLGVVGAGNVGGRLAAHAAALGMTVVACDPPRERAGDDFPGGWSILRQALACDVVSLHVPLNKAGIDATFHLLGQAELARLHAGQLLINSCRGSVIDNSALLARLQEVDAPACVLDVWEDEPDVPRALFDKVWLGTPHIAGYSQEGKLRGSWMLRVALGRWLGKELAMPAMPGTGELARDIHDWRDVLGLLQHFYRLEDDHRRLWQVVAGGGAGLSFDGLRRNYPVRHEVSSCRLVGRQAQEMEGLLNLLTGS